MRLLLPHENAMLSDAAGVRLPDALAVDCVLIAEPGHRILLSGTPAKEAGPGRYLARANLTGYRNVLTLTDETAGETAEAVLFWVPRATGMYRLSLDDNIWNLQDIARHADTYRSIFDNPYLGLMKEVHDRFGTKILMNIYYECPEHGGFTLSEMPDKFRDEFRANADWFRIGFHARADKPDRLYENVDYPTLARDIEDVRREVVRFAGEEAWAAPVTTMHWDVCSDAGMRAFRDENLRCFCVTSRILSDTESDLRLQMTDSQARQSHRYAGLYDPQYDMVYFTCDLYVNEHTPAGVRRALDENQARYPGRGFVELLIHEQYFYPDYAHYLPDYRERVLAAVGWCAEHGYHPDFMRETLLES
ncbi:MAG: hypothetical protein SO063_08450 [Eubacteriales bacterium]|nr:hypothetical protein [Eubacteriales bacterium]